MTNFRPCIDLHDGKVKQIIGGTLSDDATGLVTNFVSAESAAYFADLYRRDGLKGGHVIMLGKGNEQAAREALGAYPGGLQIGGGITIANASDWLAAGASHVILTSWLFSQDGSFLPRRLEVLAREIGPERIVVDLSCRRDSEEGWTVCMNRWQMWTDFTISPERLAPLSDFAAELLVHAADVEGRQAGMDHDLIARLADWASLPVTYAGGARSVGDLAAVERLSRGRVDLTIGSALDIFGGPLAYADCVAWNRAAAQRSSG
ncbi:MAG: phosphoribosylformimino-5-aminoimidazole carboxamide ribotide isomerase [Verrucomicrobiales bacterium]|nr:phosphoribosylformimino-5-aminoimidazole carboxamide ribotide isomerase [Verrucomicrobiales bacterium]